LVPGLLTQVQSFTQTHQQTNPNALYCGRERMTICRGAGATVPVENVTRAISLANVGVKKYLGANCQIWDSYQLREPALILQASVH